MKQKKKWLQAVECFVVVFGVALSAYGDATTVNVTVGPNADEGIGYGPYERAEILTLNIRPQLLYKIVSSECTDNTGDNIWYRESASDEEHKWVTFGVLPNFDPDPLESHAAKFHGIVARAAGGGGAGGDGGTLPFDVKVSDADADVDALGRHKDTIWPPTNPVTQGALNDLEDKSEAGASGGLAMPVTDAVETLPTTRPANSGKALQVRINAKKAGSLDFTEQGTKLAVYRQSAEEPHTQTKVTSAIGITISGLDEVFYLHTCTGFAAVNNLTTEFTPTASTDKGKDKVRVYPLTDGYQLYVNTPATTDDYVPVEANGRVPITVFREPSTAAEDLRLKDATGDAGGKHVKFYAAKTGGTGTDTKDFPVAENESSKTFYVSGSTTGTGDRTIKLYEKNGGNYVEKESLNVTVVNVTLAATGATKITAIFGNSTIDHFATPKGGAADKVTLTATIIPNTEAIRSVLDWVAATEDGANPLQATVPKKDALGFAVQVTIGGSEMKEAGVWVIWATGVAQNTAAPIDL